MGKGTPGQQREKLSLPARTSKTGKKLVFLPEDVQSRPIPHHPGVTNVPPTGPGGGGPPLKEGGASQQEDERGDERSEAEKMSKEERERGGFGRLTAYGEHACNTSFVPEELIADACPRVLPQLQRRVIGSSEALSPFFLAQLESSLLSDRLGSLLDPFRALAAFLKREHGAEVRIFDEAIYAVSVCHAFFKPRAPLSH
jgi:hypothetical protein